MEEDVRRRWTFGGVRVFDFFGGFAFLLLAVALLFLIVGRLRFAFPAIGDGVAGERGKIVRNIGAFPERRCNLGKFLEQLREIFNINKK